ncbi:RNA polymerase sigma-70 factor, ECF subfamily [Gracilibacillus orientalis]|uniref:RNA polymerase sigma-70 factor, ECF subfamily n=1 Tax=Gracilibacillus orientalis TaxID=334253 RepID=A0A1I4HR74_9BACI|nr:sigma-70 family RNA polymerase sigma factor [Gracilibacillus orientalis]SFL44808.1 RNA polymerase sigma-70 factor, ECF subfamily [Gracilibacillus orientalis]
MNVNKRFSANEGGHHVKGKRQINQLYPGLKKYSYFLTKNKWDAEDLIQDTMLKAMHYYQSSDLSPALLNKIAYHQWIDTVKKRKHEIIKALDDESQEDNAWKADRLIDLVKYIVNNLTPKQAVIFMLKEAFSYQAKEIADLLNTTEMAVKSTLHRAKKRVKNESSLQSVDSFWREEEKKLLYELLYHSLQAEDPVILIDCISEIPSLAETPKLTQQKHASSPLNMYSMAA